MIRRSALLLTSIIIFYTLWAVPAPYRVAAASSEVDTSTITFVAPGDSPQASDLQSRDGQVVVTSNPFSGVVFKWQVVGVPSDIALSARVRLNEQWSDWFLLPANDEFRAEDDPTDVLASTMLSFDAPADAWQVHIDVTPDSKSYVTSIRAITINSNPSVTTRMVLPNASASPVNGSKPPTVPRTVWGLDKYGNNAVTAWDARGEACVAIPTATPSLTPAPATIVPTRTPTPCPADATWMPEASEIARPTHIVIHHTATPNDPLTSDWASRVRSIWQYHSQTNGWGDIGYHYLIDPNGVIYEGRYKGVRPNDGTVIDGAHARGYNRASIGISMMGTYSTVAPTAAAQNALKSLMAWLMSTYEITPDTVTRYAYKNVDLNTIVGHRDVGTTTCPGAVLYGMLPSLRTTLAGIINARWIEGVRATATTIYAGDSAEFIVSIRNQYNSESISGASFSFLQSDTAHSYKQDECWAKRNASNITIFDKPAQTTAANGRFRIMAGIANWDSQYANSAVKCPISSTVNHPWRWSIGSTPLAPGASRDVAGRVQFDTVGTYTIYFGLVKDWIGYPDQVCQPASNVGVCALSPITISVITRPTATPTIPDVVRTRIQQSTAVVLTYQATAQTAQAGIQTAQAATITAVVATQAVDRITATAERTRGSPTRTATASATMTPSLTSVPILQTVSALREATRVRSANSTATAVAVRDANATSTSNQKTAVVRTRYTNLTATMLKRQAVQATNVAATASKVAHATTQKAQALTATALQQFIGQTQIADKRTATAEALLQSPTRTATASVTTSNTRTVTASRTTTATRSPSATKSNTATRTHTYTRTLSPTQTATATNYPIIDQSDVISQTVVGAIGQFVVADTRLFAVTRHEPVLYCFNAQTLAAGCTLPLEGSHAYLMQTNVLDANELVVVGQLTWNTLFVQRFDVAQSPPRETGYWTLASTALPTALLVHGRFISMALSTPIPGTAQSQNELLTLINAPTLLQLFAPRLPLPGPVTHIRPSDTGEHGLIITGRTTNNAGYITVTRLGAGRYTSTVTTIDKPIIQLFGAPTVVNLVPFNMLYTSDGTAVARYQLNLTNQAVTRLATQSLPASHIVLLQSPTQLLAISKTAPWHVTLYVVRNNLFVARGSTLLSTNEPTQLATDQTALYWTVANTILRTTIIR